MEKILDFLYDFNDITILIRILVAMCLGGIIGLEREKYRRPAGFRTHIVVCIGACLTSMASVFAVEKLGLPTDPSRIPAQVVSGLGFLGVGTILVKGKDHIVGLTTAAGLWATGVIGVACGYGFYVGALGCTFVIMITTMGFFHFEEDKKQRKRSVEVYVELEDAHSVNSFVKIIEEKFGAHNFLVVSPRSAMKDAVGLEVTFPIDEKDIDKELLDKVAVLEGVVYAVESTPKKLS